MELLYPNYINTLSMFNVLVGGTSGLHNILTDDLRFQYVTQSCNSDAIISIFQVNFASTQTVSKIILKGINWKEFYIQANGQWFTLTANDQRLNFSQNSDTSMYFDVYSKYCTSLTFVITATQVADQEKAISYLAVSDEVTDFGGRIPSAQKYRPMYKAKKVLHELADGSYRMQTFARKTSIDVSFDFLTGAVKNTLKSAFDNQTDFIFAPFGTYTGWDGISFPCIWANDFEFFAVSDNNSNVGYSGSIKLLEINT